MGRTVREVKGLFDDLGGGERFGVDPKVPRGGEKDDRDVLVARAQLCRELPAVHHRHHEIEHDHIRSERLDDRQRLVAVPSGNDLEALVL